MADPQVDFEAIRAELEEALRIADIEEAKQVILAKANELAHLENKLSLANLQQRAIVLNELSDLLDETISTIRIQIDNFLLTKLSALKQEVDIAAGNPPGEMAGGEGSTGGGPAGGSGSPPPVGPGSTGGGPATGGGGPPANIGAGQISVDLAALKAPHFRFSGSVRWQLTPFGISIDGAAPENTGGQPAMVKRVWDNFGPAIEHSAQEFCIPVELIIATICTESSGNPNAIRKEPGYVSDSATPHRVSPGMMQTLISTARNSLPGVSIDRAWLFVPANSIRAGTAYMRKQAGTTKLDPPVVACAYNAGRVAKNTGAANRWKMRQFPIGTSEHADRFVKWFNDCFKFFAANGSPALSFHKLLN